MQEPSGSTLHPSVALAIPVSIHRYIVATVGCFNSLLLRCGLLLSTRTLCHTSEGVSTLLSFSSFPISHKGLDRPTVHLHTLAPLLSRSFPSFRFSIHSVTSSPHIQLTRGRQTCQPLYNNTTTDKNRKGVGVGQYDISCWGIKIYRYGVVVPPHTIVSHGTWRSQPPRPRLSNLARARRYSQR